MTDWVANTPVALEVQRRFRRFLRTFTDDKGQRVYMQRIEAMVLGECGRVGGRVGGCPCRGAAAARGCTFTSDTGSTSPIPPRPPPKPKTANRQSLEVTYGDLITSNGCQILAVFVADAPRPVLALFDRAATDLVHQLYEQYSAIHNEVFVRFTRLPVDDKIRDLR